MGPITVVKAGTKVNSASGTDILLNSKYPFTKLDTANLISFQTISILFSNEPPQPTFANEYTQTLLYSFPHGYDYIPSIWMTWQNDSPEFPAAPPLGSATTSYYPFGDDTVSSHIITPTTNFPSTGLFALTVYTADSGTQDVTGAFIGTTVDDTNVNIYACKGVLGIVEPGDIVVPILLAGFTLDMRVYVFTEPADTSTY